MNHNDFENWLSEAVDGLNDRESLFRLKTVWSEDNNYHKAVGLREVLREAYDFGYLSGDAEGYFQGNYQ